MLWYKHSSRGIFLGRESFFGQVELESSCPVYLDFWLPKASLESRRAGFVRLSGGRQTFGGNWEWGAREEHLRGRLGAGELSSFLGLAPSVLVVGHLVLLGSLGSIFNGHSKLSDDFFSFLGWKKKGSFSEFLQTLCVSVLYNFLFPVRWKAHGLLLGCKLKEVWRGVSCIVGAQLLLAGWMASARFLAYVLAT